MQAMIKRFQNRLKSDPRISSIFWLAIVSAMCAYALSSYMGLTNYAAACLAIPQYFKSLSAGTVIALAASTIAVIGFVREVPAWSQLMAKSGSGQTVAPCHKGEGQEMVPAKGGVSFKQHGIARRYILESVTLSIPTNDPAVASEIVMVVESKDKKLYEGAISIGNDLLSADESVGKGGYYSVTRNVACGFSGDLTYSIFNHTNQTLMCYTIFRARSTHSLGELILEKYLPVMSWPVIMAFRLANHVLAFQPDYWVRRLLTKNKSG